MVKKLEREKPRFSRQTKLVEFSSNGGNDRPKVVILPHLSRVRRGDWLMTLSLAHKNGQRIVQNRLGMRETAEAYLGKGQEREAFHTSTTAQLLSRKQQLCVSDKSLCASMQPTVKRYYLLSRNSFDQSPSSSPLFTCAVPPKWPWSFPFFIFLL